MKNKYEFVSNTELLQQYTEIIDMKRSDYQRDLLNELEKEILSRMKPQEIIKLKIK